MDYEHELRVLKIAEGIDEDIQLKRSEYFGEIVDEMFFLSNNENLEKLLSLLVLQIPREDDMVTSELRKIYNAAVLSISEDLYDPTDLESDHDK